MNYVLRISILYTLVSVVTPSRILCFFPNPSRSHAIVPLSIAEELGARGHDVTVITMNKLTSNDTHVNEIVIPVTAWDNDFLKTLVSGNIKSTRKFIATAAKLYQEVVIEAIAHPLFQRLMAEESFDLVWFINVYYNGVQLGVADHFRAPFIMYCPLAHLYLVEEVIGQHLYPATVPSLYYEVLPKMNLPERVVNMLYTVTEWAFSKYYDRVQANQYAKVWPQNSRDYYEMKRNASILLLNGHNSESQIIRPMLPNEIEVGGVQIEAHPKPLIPEVQEFLDNATDGVIVWTFGSNLPIFMIDPEKTAIMFKVLARLKQKVLLKWEKDPSVLPANFKGLKWIQQDSALAHKNVKLFITHGGYGGLMEALFHKVPVFGIPFFSDQDYNVMKAKADGWARGMKLYEVTENLFEEAITDLLTNPKYQERTNELSKIFVDRITPPMETAVFWIEYVLRHKGAAHLTYQGKDMNWIQLYSVDVIFILGTLIFGSVFTLVWLIRKVFERNDKRKTE